MSFGTARVDDIGDALTIGGSSAAVSFGSAIVAEAACVLVEAEEFRRVVALGETWGQSEFGGTPDWIDDSPFILATAAAVDGENATSTSATSFPGAEGQQKIASFNIQLPIEMEVRFHLHGVLVNSVPGVQFGLVAPGFTNAVFLSATASTFPENQIIGVSWFDPTTDDFVDSPPGAILFDTWYTARVAFQHDVIKCRWWADGDPDPVAWTLSLATPGAVADAVNLDNYLRVVTAAQNAGTGSSIWIDYIRFYACPAS